MQEEEPNNLISVWMQQIRAPFLILSVVLVLIGVASAADGGIFRWDYTVLLMLGIVLAHISVNLFNELSDHKTGIDAQTDRTPFSGGSGMMLSGKTKFATVRIVAYGTLFAAAGIGTFFFIKQGWPILVLMVVGAVSIRFYTSHLARWLMGEFAAGLSLGTLVVLGTHYAIAGYWSIEVLLISIPPGMLTTLLLFLNEFPDADADRQGGRRHMIIQLGKKRCALIYAGGLLFTFLWIIAVPFISDVSFYIYLSLATVPLAVMAGTLVLKHREGPMFIRAMGMNVSVVILTDLLLATGLFIG